MFVVDLLGWKISARKPADSLNRVLFYITKFLLLRLYSLSLHFDILSIICLAVGLFVINPFWNLLYFLHLDVCFLSQVREYSPIFLQINSLPLYLSGLILGPPCDANITALGLSLMILKVPSLFLFYLCCSDCLKHTVLSSSALIIFPFPVIWC